MLSSLICSADGAGVGDGEGGGWVDCWVFDDDAGVACCLTVPPRVGRDY